MPKRGVNMHENELTRAFKTVNDSYVEPISFIVPRRAETFQDDIYPPTTGSTPAMNASEWFSGKEAIPAKISMASLYDGQGVQEVTGAVEKPTGTLDAPAPKPAEPEVKKAAEPTVVKPTPREPVSEPTPAARPAVSMKDQGASMAAMVNKFADDEEETAPVEDDSSFEEVAKPVERPSRTATESSSPRVSTPVRKEPEAKPQPAATPSPVSAPAPAPAAAPATSVSDLVFMIKEYHTNECRPLPPLPPPGAPTSLVILKRSRTLSLPRPRPSPTRRSRCRP